MHVANRLAAAERSFRSGGVIDAERILKRVLASDPASTKANELFAYILGNRGDVEGALRRLQIATRRAGDWSCVIDAVREALATWRPGACA